MIRICVICFLLLLIAGGATKAQTFPESSIRAHINVLASDSLEGRGTGTQGEVKASNYIASRFAEIGLQPKGEESGFFQPFGVVISFEGIPHQAKARNVVGYLDNGAAKTIVIGAHYDHLGKGHQAGSLAPNSREMIHNGADDNASGVAGLIELARYFTSNNLTERFNLLFIAFSGEELGLLGSKYFTTHPTIPLENISFMINMDMIGRLEEDKGINIGGWGTSQLWGRVLPGLARAGDLKYSVDSSGVGPSDHTSFYLKQKPVLFFFTGAHTDYHKPSDDASKINATGVGKVLELITGLVEHIHTSGDNPSFIEARNPHAGATQQAFNVTLGIIPDYSYAGKGLRIDGVTQDRPAARAGIVAGDVIIRMGIYTIYSIQEYMKALNVFQKGQTVEVEFKRGKENKVVKVAF